MHHFDKICERKRKEKKNKNEPRNVYRLVGLEHGFVTMCHALGALQRHLFLKTLNHHLFPSDKCKFLSLVSSLLVSEETSIGTYIYIPSLNPKSNHPTRENVQSILFN